MIIAIDQSTSATKALLFDDNCKLLKQVGVPHKQYYPQPGWVEHNAEEIWQNTITAIKEALSSLPREGQGGALSLAITNQRETVVIWDRETGTPIYNAVVWQCMRGQQICEDLKAKGYGPMVKEKAGLLIDPYFAGSGAKWILDNVEGAREKAEAGKLCFGTIDSWLIYKLTGGKVHATDYTNASRTMLFNVHTLDWDDELLQMLTIPRSMMPKPLPCDAIYGELSEEVANELFSSLPTGEGGGRGLLIAGVLGDSHGALSGQMCFLEGYGKATYGTGSSVMVNIGEQYAPAPDGLVTSIGFSALGKTYYAFEGNIHCTGATLNWLRDQLELINGPQEVEAIATSVPDNGGVYFVPAFSGLGAPWWNTDAKAAITGMTLASKKAHVVRAALESIAYQVTDLIRTMTDKAGITLREIRVDGGPTKNKFLMQMQSDLLQVPVVRSEVEDASAFGALVMNRFALGAWKSFADAEASWEALGATTPLHSAEEMQPTYDGWKKAVSSLMHNA